MVYTFLNLAYDVLEKEKKPMTINEIWLKATELKLNEKLSSFGKTPEKTLSAQIYVNIKQNPEKSPFIQVSKRPTLFSLKEFSNVNIEVDNESQIEKTSYKERDLHIILSSFVFSDSHFKCYTKTIRHEKSTHRQKGYNSWLHPDIVGVRYPFEDYGDRTRELMKSLVFNSCKLFSFELKISITFATLREKYFQAVSNSTWANEGYLVAVEYDNDPDLIDEMRRLNNTFGIGFIRLDIEDYTQSEIILSARNNDLLDFNTIDRLCEDNKNYNSLMHTISSDLTSGELRNINDFDKYFIDEDDFKMYVKDKKIKLN